MFSLFTVMILPALMIGSATLSFLIILIWLLINALPGPVIPVDDEDEVVGDGSTLRRGFCPAYPATFTTGQE